MSVVRSAEVVLTVALLARMAYAGFRPPVGRLFSWPMYTYATTVVVTVTVIGRDGVERKLNPYDDFPRGEFLLPPDQLEVYLRFLRQTYPVVRCSGYAYGDFGEAEIILTGEHVALVQPE